MRKFKLFALILGTLMLSGGSATAADWSLSGGRTLDVYDNAVRFGVGWPDFHVALHLPITKELELAPKIGFFYGYPLVKGCCTFGNTVGSELRYTVLDSGDLHLALKNDFGIEMNYVGGFAFGFRLGAGLVGDYNVSQQVNALFSFNVPVDLSVTPGVVAVIPILFGGGIEFVPKDVFALWAKLELGPGILAAGGGAIVDFALIGQAGIGYRF